MQMLQRASQVTSVALDLPRQLLFVLDALTLLGSRPRRRHGCRGQESISHACSAFLTPPPYQKCRTQVTVCHADASETILPVLNKVTLRIPCYATCNELASCAGYLHLTL
eukprot:955511-Pleurochrysis_carterae.AAC.4